MSSWHSYPKLYAMGHRAIAEILFDEVLVQEKVDGSQFSFGLFPVLPEGTHHDMCGDPMGCHPDCRVTPLTFDLKVRSKGATFPADAPEKMFSKAVETVKSIEHLLKPGWTYRGEYLAKPKHNTLAYDRAPKGYIALFDINTGEEHYADYNTVASEAERLGLDVVPTFYRGRIETLDEFRALLDHESFLGGQKIEGVVVKNYSRFGPDKKVLMGKFVSEAFKEAHQGDWRDRNPTKADIIQTLITLLRTPARWSKAVQHLREAGKLEGSPRDIGALIKETQKDVETECREEIVDALWSHAWPQVARGVIGGLPEWYKEQLLKQQFEQEPSSAAA